MPAEGIRKLYYSIGEVSQITELEQHVLRYGETEFPELSPQKNRAGRRIYTRTDIEFIDKIRQLLKEEKYTIEGARKALAQADVNKSREDALRSELLAIRNFLTDILSRL